MRHKIIAMLAALFLLVSCSGEAQTVSLLPAESEAYYSREDASSLEESPSTPAPSQPSAESEASEELSEEEIFTQRLDEIMWEIDWNLDPEALIYYYFDLIYLSYSSLREVDLTPVLDMGVYNTYNLERWFNNLVQRRRLLKETGLCYVDTAEYEYTISMIGEDELDDIRMDFWEDAEREEIPEEEYYFHFVITGEPGKVYPPLMAVNSQQTIRMARQPDGGWRINLHYFPGAVRKYIRTSPLEYREDNVVLDELYEEFAVLEEPDAPPPPDDATYYNGEYAVLYAEEFTERHNENFYRVNDWNGNCQNFLSQCVIHGFGNGDNYNPRINRLMDDAWYSGGGGGSFAWENVDFFWDYATSGSYMRCQVLDGVSLLQAGDVIQTRNRFTHQDEDPNDYNHTLLVMDRDTLLLSQNTPACYVYYSDLVNTAPRFIRPLYR